MKFTISRFIKKVAERLLMAGFDPRVLLSYRYFFRYLRDKKAWIAKGGEISKNYMILSDYGASAGSTKGHYFHQDLLVARLIFKNNPVRHLDIGSRIDGFVAHVASFREIEVSDIRPLSLNCHDSIKFIQADLMKPINLGKTDSLSCLHAIEHFGLGRYTDSIDVNGHVKGIEALVSLVETGGRLYISFPIGMEDETHFNAHRVFHPETILSLPVIQKNMILERFDFVDDAGNLHLDVSIGEAVGQTTFGCGIYTFIRH